VKEINQRETILRQATGLFIAHGYSGLSMRQIAEAADISKAGIYYHFRDKESLFLAILENHLAEMAALMDQVMAQEKESSKRIEQVIRAILHQPAEKRSIIRLAMQEMPQLSPNTRQQFGKIYRELFIDRLQNIIAEGVRNRELKVVTPNVATWALLGIMHPFFYSQDTNRLQVTEEVIDQVVAVFLTGIKA